MTFWQTWLLRKLEDGISAVTASGDVGRRLFARHSLQRIWTTKYLSPLLLAKLEGVILVVTVSIEVERHIRRHISVVIASGKVGRRHISSSWLIDVTASVEVGRRDNGSLSLYGSWRTTYLPSQFL